MYNMRPKNVASASLEGIDLSNKTVHKVIEIYTETRGYVRRPGSEREQITT